VTLQDTIARQKLQRQQCLEAILQSPARKKLIVAGPGTGKTYALEQVLKQRSGGNNLGMTFINNLVDDLERRLSAYAKIRTFHRYCKSILHQRHGRVELVPYLPKIIESDARLLGRGLSGFGARFRDLDEHCPEVAFYLRRGDYYSVVGFDDSVYRLLMELRADPNILPDFDQIIIDEYQDFNALEVALIDELEKKGPIVIVGDDDQAVYDDRRASPDHLRRKHSSGEYEVFQLPFCTRCPQVIVEATHAVVEAAQSRGYLRERLPKPFECYLEAKQLDNARYPRIVVAQCTVNRVITSYLAAEIGRIPPEDIAESWKDDYPTVLVVGPRQYLREAEKQLLPTYPQLSYKPSLNPEYSMAEAYQLLLDDKDSNLGWRILTEVCLPWADRKRIVGATEDGTAMVGLLEPSFVLKHLGVVEVLRKLKNGDLIDPMAEAGLRTTLADEFLEVTQKFAPHKETEAPEADTNSPSIRLTSYKGCKGLSAGHVFLVGMNNGDMPKDPNHIRDVEISQFIVALTRTRKQCHLISNKWLYRPQHSGLHKSAFVSWLPPGLTENRGHLCAADLK
jgi:superfamily I DNA/RNA helicase